MPHLQAGPSGLLLGLASTEGLGVAALLTRICLIRALDRRLRLVLRGCLGARHDAGGCAPDWGALMCPNIAGVRNT